MLTLERAELIDQILAHQRELSIPVETKTLRFVRMLVTSILIFQVLTILKPIALNFPPIVNLLLEIVVGAAAAYGMSIVWPYVRSLSGRAAPPVVFTRQLLESMTLEELQGLERDMQLQVQERGDRAFMSEETEEKIIGFGTFIVFCLASYVCYAIAMSMRGFGSVTLSLIFTFGGGALAAGVVSQLLTEPLRKVMRFFVRHREYIFYGALILAFSVTRLTAK